MACKDDKKLDKFEPEHDDRTWTRNVGHIFLICIISFMIVNIIASSVNQIGTRKSQVTSFENPSQIDFTIGDLKNLMGVRLFANISTKSIE